MFMALCGIYKVLRVTFYGGLTSTWVAMSRRAWSTRLARVLGDGHFVLSTDAEYEVSEDLKCLPRLGSYTHIMMNLVLAVSCLSAFEPPLYIMCSHTI